MKPISVVLSFFLTLTIVCQVMAEVFIQPQQIYPRVCEEKIYSFPESFLNWLYSVMIQQGLILVLYFINMRKAVTGTGKILNGHEM